ncbi:MAG: hypothetical protein ACW99A_06705 [Candidatus Kariarchaeaceae archaeon]|jgi:hypothetical protein
MAPIGSVIKNGLIFLILLLPIAYISGLMISAAIVDLNYAAEDIDDEHDGNAIPRDDIDKGSGTYYATAVQEIAIAIVLLFGIGGLVFMKSLSDSVEDGMVEF